MCIFQFVFLRLSFPPNTLFYLSIGNFVTCFCTIFKQFSSNKNYFPPIKLSQISVNHNKLILFLLNVCFSHYYCYLVDNFAVCNKLHFGRRQGCQVFETKPARLLVKSSPNYPFNFRGKSEDLATQTRLQRMFTKVSAESGT